MVWGENTHEERAVLDMLGVREREQATGLKRLAV